MKSTDSPRLIETVIASGANASYVRTIPKTQTKSGSGEMSLALGWPPECAIPVAAGGKYPQMADANGVLNLLSAAVQQLQARFFGAYNADFAAAIGGYPLNAIVSDTTAGKFWVSTAEDNTTAPGADGAKWQNLFNGYATEAWANSAFVKNNAGTQGGIVAIDLDSDGSGRAAFERKDGSWGILQPAGDYATHSDLSGYLKNANGGIGGEQSGTSLVYQISARRPFFSYNNNGAGGNLAWYSDVVGEATARANADNTLQANITTVESKLPLPDGMHCQIFSEAIPNPCPAEGWLVNIPTGWSTHSFVTACDTGENVYAVSAKVENATQARLWAKYPTNGAWAAGGVVTVTSYGYYSS